MGKMIIYQVLPRLWGKGKFSEFDSETMSYFKSLGVSHVLYTGLGRRVPGIRQPDCQRCGRFALCDYRLL